MPARRIIGLTAIAVMSCLVLYVAAIAARRPRPVDLRVLGELHPGRKTYPDGSVTYTFHQTFKEVQVLLDKRMNSATGWEAGGSEKLNYVWYHREGWRDTIPGLLADLGFSSTMVYMKSQPAGVEVTVMNDGAILP